MSILIGVNSNISHYRIVSKIGEGGMGEVWRASDTTLGRDVAIKILPSAFSEDSERLRRFEQEAQAVGALNHPNILVIHHIGTHEGSPYIVSELLEGETLRERMAGAALPQRKAIDYALQITRGLAAAHAKGIIHRDLKPENLFVTNDGRVKILDFGLAKLTGVGSQPQTEVPTRRVNTDPGTVMGTVGYMSPEQLRGRPVDHRSDIFSFGAILYEMLSGKRAFRGESTADTMSAILREDPPHLSEINRAINPAVESVVDHCLEKNPEERFHSASDLGFALEALSSMHSSGVTTTVAAEEFVRPRLAFIRRRLGWIASALLLISTLALVALYFRRAEPRVDIMRFTLPAPAQADYGDSLALSPDGRQLVFVIAGSEAQSGLWIRSLDSLGVRQLPDTDGAAFPFWSPDSRSIGFFAHGKLKKIDVAGGPSQPLADVSSDPRGGTWGPDGTILYTPDTTSPLLKISASGGTPLPLTELDKTREQTTHRWPWFLPDGKHFIYFARGDQPASAGIFVGALDSRDAKFLVSTPLRAAFAQQSSNILAGYLLFMRGTTLVAQRFNPTSLQLSGEPVTIANDLLTYPTTIGPTGYAAYSTSANGNLIYLSGNEPTTQLAWLDRAGKLLGTISDSNAFFEPWLSPDGKIIVATRGGNERNLWLLDVARRTTTRFTFDPAVDVAAVWSPDGSHIAFASNRGGEWGLYQKISSGAGSDELLLRTGADAFTDDWSTDGRFILYQLDEGAKDKFDLCVLPLFGDRKAFCFIQTSATESNARFSPNGEYVAYVSDESGRAEVYVQSFPPSGGKWQISTAGGDQPQWRKDGKELFYLGSDRKLMSVSVETGTPFKNGTPTPLFETHVPPANIAGIRNHYVAASDGQRFLVNNVLEEGNSQPITIVLNWASALTQ